MAEESKRRGLASLAGSKAFIASPRLLRFRSLAWETRRSAKRDQTINGKIKRALLSFSQNNNNNIKTEAITFSILNINLI